MGQSYIKYTILLGRPTHIIYDITGEAHLPGNAICDIIGWAHYI
jgi:hypothetical protein